MNFLKSHYISIFFISMLPVIEVKGGLVFAAVKNLNLWIAMIVCLAASTVIIPILLKFMFPMLNKLKNVKPFKKWATKTLDKAERKKNKLVEKEVKKENKFKNEKFKNFLKYFSIFVFVAVPLPGTGVYTGCLLSAIMNLNKVGAGVAVFLGNVVATVLSALTVAGVIMIF